MAALVGELETLRMNVSDEQLIEEAVAINHGQVKEGTVERYRDHLYHLAAYLDSAQGVSFYTARRRHVNLFMRQFRGEHEWLPDDPAAIIAGHLNDLWRYCTAQWLRLHTTDPDSERRPPVEPWWDALARLDFGTGILVPDDTYRRAQPPGGDPARLTGTLISLAAAWRIYDLDTACQALAAHIHAHPGPDAFRTAVHARTSRWPVPVPAPSLPAPLQLPAADLSSKGATRGERLVRWLGRRGRATTA